MLLFKIIYYCYFRLASRILFGQLNKENAAKIFSLCLMSVLSTFLSMILIHYITNIIYINIVYCYIVCTIFMVIYYLGIVHNDRHEDTIRIVHDIHHIWRIVCFIAVYSVTILAFIIYLKLPIKK